MNGVVLCNPIGSLFGNATMSWLHAYAHAKRVGAEFQCRPWIGEEVFRLPEYARPDVMSLPRRTELDLQDTETNVEIRTYAQSQRAMIYTKTEAMEWLQFKHSVEEIFAEPLSRELLDTDVVLGHLRRGDYHGYGFPTVSVNSYAQAAASHSFFKVQYIQQENPTPKGTLPNEISFLPDFYRLCVCPVLFRANSSFSWLAGLLNQGRVYAPKIDGLQGGIEHDNVPFVRGNWPRLASFDFTTDLHVQSE